MLVLNDFPDRNVCIVGLGYVGLTLAVAMADVGFHVLGVEIRDDVLANLKQGKSHFFEPGLDEQLRKVMALGRLSFVKTLPDDPQSSVYIITLGTPLSHEGRARMEPIGQVAKDVAVRLKPGDLVVTRSTVKIGTTRNVILPALQTANVSFDLAFCPERTLEGQALTELRQLPQIVGGINHKSTVRAAQLFHFVTPTVVRVSDAETAEMIKLVDNSQRNVQFAYANEVARISDAIGISGTEVIAAGKLGYPRTNLPMPGPVGGPCLEKDPYILVESVENYGIVPELTLQSRQLNERQLGEVALHLGRVSKELVGFPHAPMITLAGLAFKGRPATDDLRGTTARPLIDGLKAIFPGARFKGYDAVVSAEGILSLGLEPVSSLEEAFDGCHLLVIHNNHTVFSAMPIERLSATMAAPGIIYDFWNHFSAPALNLAEGRGYMALGSHGLFRLSTNSEGAL